MKFKVGYTLEQLLESYNKEAEIPELLSDEKISIYGQSFIASVKRKESWIDDALETYFETEQFFLDLQYAEEEWENRSEFYNYWLQLECDSDKRIRLAVDMEIKDF